MTTATTPLGAPSLRPIDIVRRLLAPLAGVVGILAIWWAIGFLVEEDGPANLLAGLYDTIGLDGQAEAIRERGIPTLTSKLILAVVALGVGVGGIWAVYIGANAVVERLGDTLKRRVLPWVFVGPALLLLSVYLVFPSVSTVATSLTEDGGAAENFGFVLTDPDMLVALRNNALWLVLATGGSVAIGLVIATLVDRVKREALAKTFIFLPLAISMVGAAVIWRFVYAWAPPGQPQIGLANAVWTSAGNDPVAWLQVPTLNTFALILIMVWLQTGFAMVVLSAAIKGVPTEVIEAARIDGARESQVFFRVIVPMIKGSIITVGTTIAIAVLKVFDIVFVTTGGRFESDVIANLMFTEFFRFRNFGHASALAVILFLAVVPLMVINVRNLRRQGIGS
ncbi:MAG TPA: sugar ABC transporter permease [Candidatus Limnocylindria bacterium]|nr:sugar ABC transporter permease [Candidatus Limnocylindria bacterium]